ncbi:hypothetical protein KP1_4570 [Klebsiella pneumoniae subsp. pneumoniae NTUH-K2044]|nr:hypothetical protein KP1_4570 [Klebsiella pneumoniae subsp. pneumoniae NTUH-K2044]
MQLTAPYFRKKKSYLIDYYLFLNLQLLNFL